MGHFYNATLFQADITLTQCCSLNVESPLCVEKLPPQLEMLFEKVLELSGSRASLQETGDWGVKFYSQAPLPVYFYFMMQAQCYQFLLSHCAFLAMKDHVPSNCEPRQTPLSFLSYVLSKTYSQ